MLLFFPCPKLYFISPPSAAAAGVRISSCSTLLLQCMTLGSGEFLLQAPAPIQALLCSHYLQFRIPPRPGSGQAESGADEEEIRKSEQSFARVVNISRGCGPLLAPRPFSVFTSRSRSQATAFWTIDFTIIIKSVARPRPEQGGCLPHQHAAVDGPGPS